MDSFFQALEPRAEAVEQKAAPVDRAKVEAEIAHLEATKARQEIELAELDQAIVNQGEAVYAWIAGEAEKAREEKRAELETHYVNTVAKKRAVHLDYISGMADEIEKKRAMLEESI